MVVSRSNRSTRSIRTTERRNDDTQDEQPTKKAKTTGGRGKTVPETVEQSSAKAKGKKPVTEDEKKKIREQERKKYEHIRNQEVQAELPLGNP